MIPSGYDSITLWRSEASDREDLLGEATALVERIEFLVPSSVHGTTADRVVVGFRANGCASIFFGADPVYQFNSVGELRRGYDQGELLKASGGNLVAMRRERGDGRVELVSRQLGAEEAAKWLAAARQRLAACRDGIAGGGWEVVGQYPPDGAVCQRVAGWLDSLGALKVAATPHAR